VGRVEDVPQKMVTMVQATTSQVSSGSALPQEKLKLAYKLLGVSSRITRVLVFRSSSVYLSFCFIFLTGGVRVGGQPAPGQLRARCSESAGEEALVREGCPSGEEQETLQGQERLVF